MLSYAMHCDTHFRDKEFQVKDEKTWIHLNNKKKETIKKKESYMIGTCIRWYFKIKPSEIGCDGAHFIITNSFAPIFLCVYFARAFGVDWVSDNKANE